MERKENLHILSEIIILMAETPLSVLDARWKNISWGLSNHCCDITSADRNALSNSSSMVGKPGFLLKKAEIYTHCILTVWTASGLEMLSFKPFTFGTSTQRKMHQSKKV